MPQAMQYKVSWMTQRDLLNSYAELQGVADALNGISMRMRFENHLAGAIEDVVYNYDALESGFLTFFTQLCHHIRCASIEIDHNSQHCINQDVPLSSVRLRKLQQI